MPEACVDHTRLDLLYGQQPSRVGLALLTDDAAHRYETWVGMGDEDLVLKDPPHSTARESGATASFVTRLAVMAHVWGPDLGSAWAAYFRLHIDTYRSISSDMSWVQTSGTSPARRAR